MALDTSNELAYAGDRDDERSDAARWLSPLRVDPRRSAPWRPGPGSRSRWCRWSCRTRRTFPTTKREAVLRAVDELGYRPDPVARSLAERRTRTVGVVIDDLSNPWYVALLDGLRPCCTSTVCGHCSPTGARSPTPSKRCGPSGGRPRAGRHGVGVGRRPGRRTREPGTDGRRGHAGAAPVRRRPGRQRRPQAALSWRPGTCSNSATAASPTSSAKARWGACVAPATRR